MRHILSSVALVVGLATFAQLGWPQSVPDGQRSRCDVAKTLRHVNELHQLIDASFGGGVPGHSRNRQTRRQRPSNKK